MGLATQAHAQNSVTLYGVVDTGLMYLHNNGGKSTQIFMTSGGEWGSRVGFKGSEDLGGGLKAIFQLENQFSSADGSLQLGGREFGRQAFVGLSGNSWGTLTLGRQYDPTIDLVQPIQGDYYMGGFFTTPGDVDNADNSARFNNSIKWASPSWSGIKVSTMYSLGGVAGSVGSGQTYSGAVSYAMGPVALAAGGLHIDNGNPTVSARLTTSADSLFNSSVNNAYASARSIDIARVGGSYTIGQLILGGYYSFSTYSPDGSSTFGRAEKYHNGSIFGVYQVTPSVLAELGIDYLKSLGDSSAKREQASAALDYNLSKRTDIYGVVAYGHASGQDGLGTAQAVIGSWDIDSGKSSQAMVTVGFRHRF
jgi:predicted porin